ncbi:MaoC family dehydratase [Pararhodobacter sp.]|uniref:MaoC family dehydratase n=1 Tax=Pararhodobacter sp. TaxID=2127056 RepID=UPI002FDDE83A
MQRYLEDFTLGETWTSREVVLSEEDIIRYARENDPQPIHTDPVAAAQGRFGTVIASGWQLAALSMRLFIEAGGYGDTPVIGLGIEDLRWRRPVRPGDRLQVSREVVGVEHSATRPGFGVIRTGVTMRNQKAEVVMTLATLGQVPARPAP